MARCIATGVLAVEQLSAHQVEVPPGWIDHAEFTAQEQQEALDGCRCLVVPLPSLEDPGGDPAAFCCLVEGKPQVTPAQVLEIPELAVAQRPPRDAAQGTHRTVSTLSTIEDKPRGAIPKLLILRGFRGAGPGIRVRIMYIMLNNGCAGMGLWP